jgi:hypothetical protein
LARHGRTASGGLNAQKLDGYAQLITDSQDGCDWTILAKDGLNAVSGVASTVAVAAGGAALASKGGAINWVDETGAAGRPAVIPLTTSQAAQMAARPGYWKLQDLSYGQRVFTNGKTFITQDTTPHTGGLWKMARTVDDLWSGTTRMETYDYNLNYVGK